MASSSGVAAPMGRRHWPTLRPRARQDGLGGQGVGVLLGRLEVEGVEQFGVAGDGGRQIATQEGVHHGPELRPDPVGGHADHPDGADGEERKGHHVVAAVDLEAGRHPGRQMRRPGRVGGGILQADDGRHLAGQAEHRGARDAATGSNRDVVEHHGQPVAGLGHGPEVGLDAGLGGAVVVRGDGQQAVDAARRRQLGRPDRMLGVVGAGAGNDRDGDRVGHGAPQVGLLLIGQHRALPGGAAEHQAVAAVGGQPSGQVGRSLDVQPARVVERGHHGGDDPSESRRVRSRAHEHVRLPADSRVTRGTLSLVDRGVGQERAPEQGQETEPGEARSRKVDAVLRRPDGRPVSRLRRHRPLRWRRSGPRRRWRPSR